MINKTNKINTSSELLQNQIGVETVKKIPDTYIHDYSLSGLGTC